MSCRFFDSHKCTDVVITISCVMAINDLLPVSSDLLLRSFFFLVVMLGSEWQGRSHLALRYLWRKFFFNDLTVGMLFKEFNSIYAVRILIETKIMFYSSTFDAILTNVWIIFNSCICSIYLFWWYGMPMWLWIFLCICTTSSSSFSENSGSVTMSFIRSRTYWNADGVRIIYSLTVNAWDPVQQTPVKLSLGLWLCIFSNVSSFLIFGLIFLLN